MKVATVIKFSSSVTPVKIKEGRQARLTIRLNVTVDMVLKPQAECQREDSRNKSGNEARVLCRSSNDEPWMTEDEPRRRTYLLSVGAKAPIQPVSQPATNWASSEVQKPEDLRVTTCGEQDRAMDADVIGTGDLTEV